MRDSGESMEVCTYPHYRAVVEEFETPLLGKCRSHGIEAMDDNGHVLRRWSDVTVDRDEIDWLIGMLNQYRAAVFHVEDILLNLLK